MTLKTIFKIKNERSITLSVTHCTEHFTGCSISWFTERSLNKNEEANFNKQWTERFSTTSTMGTNWRFKFSPFHARIRTTSSAIHLQRVRAYETIQRHKSSIKPDFYRLSCSATKHGEIIHPSWATKLPFHHIWTARRGGGTFVFLLAQNVHEQDTGEQFSKTKEMSLPIVTTDAL